MSLALATAIKAAHAASTALLPLAQMWTPWAPETATPPLITFTFTGGGTEGSMKSGGINYINRVMVQFTVFVDEFSMSQGWTIYAALVALYDNNRIGDTLSDGSKVLMVKRMNNGIVMDQPEGGFGIAVDYEYAIQ